MKMSLKARRQSINIENAIMDELLDEDGTDAPATHRDLCSATDLSSNLVTRTINSLLERGLIEPYMTLPQIGGNVSTVYRLRRTARAA